MALQGDLDSFALPDVLRLLAGTGKTGRLAVTAADRAGEVWLHDGDVVGGSVSSAPHAEQAADLVFELLRVEGGSFAFEDGELLVDGGDRTGVDDAIADAEALVVEWTEVETVVPSVHAPVALAAELPGEEITVSAESWRLLASLRPASTVRSLGDQFLLTDLVASRTVKALVEEGLVELGEAPAPVEPSDTFGLGGFVETDDDPDAELPPVEVLRDDLAILSAEDGPVVLESSDDALLPEPLPGEGTSFEGDLGMLGSVDGRSFESIEAEAAASAPALGEATSADDWQSHGDFDDQVVDESHEPTWDAAPLAELPEDLGAAQHGADESGAEADEVSEDDDRGSLLRFLSTVKP